MEIKRSIFGKLDSGEEVSLFTLKNDGGMEMSVTNYGATIVTLLVPDKNGNAVDTVLGFDSIEGYISADYKNACPYFGCTVGRFSNRIKNARFELYGKEYNISRNEGANSLHGGKKGFDKRLWAVSGERGCNKHSAYIEMTLLSPDGDQGYPGNLETTVKFSLWSDNSIMIEYAAVSDADTLINLTNHSYFNLEGEGSGDILDSSLFIPSNLYINLDEELIPDGKVLDVSETSLDFREPSVIRDVMKIDGNDKITGGYSHTYILKKRDTSLSLAARLTAPISGRIMEVYTSEIGILLYTGDGLDGSFKGKSGMPYEKWAGICLETQGLPDAPNHGHFATNILRAGEKYSSKTVYKFLTE